MMMDSKGFIWLGTNDGLNRFDGKEFVVFRRTGKQKFSLSGNVVTDIVEDTNGTFWVSTRDGGICNVNMLNGEVFHPKLISENGSEQVYVHCLLLGSNGELYVGTDKGIYWSKDKQNFSLVPKGGIESCYDLELLNGRILAALNIRSVCEIKPDSVVMLTNKKQEGVPYPAHSLNDLFLDNKNNLWVAAWDNFLHKYEPDTETLSHINVLHAPEISYNDDEIASITEAEPGKLWLVLKSFQILEYNIATGESKRIQFSQRETTRLNGQRIYFVYTDKLFRTWIGTDNGLHLRDPQSSRFDISYLKDQSTVTDFIGLNDQLYFSSNTGVFHYDNRNHQIELISGKQPVKCYSLAAQDNDLLVGTNVAINRLNMKSQQLSRWTDRLIKSFDVNNIASSRFNSIKSVNIENETFTLASPYGHGIILADVPSGKWILGNLLNQEGIENLIREIHQDSKGRIWFLGSISGISKLNYLHLREDMTPLKAEAIFTDSIEVAQFESTCYNKGLLSKEVTAISERADGTFWISTQGAGLYTFDPDNTATPFLPITSPSQSMQNMVADNDGNLWIIASGGLHNYNVKQQLWRKFDERDGIPTEGLSNAIFKDLDGKVYVGGNGFFFQFDPATISTTNEIPTPRITHISVMDQSMDTLLAQASIILDHDKNFLSFAFTSLCFSDPSSIIYEYRLDGLDENWRNNGNDNKVSYSNLSPGEYTFRVRANSQKGVISTSEAAITFTILQPYYFRWWFILLLILLVASGVWLLLAYRKRQREKLAIVRNKIARDLHDDIGSALGSISFFSETAKRTLDDHNTEGTNKVLEKIGSTSREMIENMHDIVWAVNPANDGMDQIIERMKSYAADMAASDHILLHFSSDDELASMKLSMAERKNIFLVFKEAIYNSCKYSDCKNLTVEIKRNTKNKLVMSITDDGKGFDLHSMKRNGNGLRNMKTRAEEIGAQIEITSEVEKGTRVEVTL
jgi:ligand-binding sensor domain-containing protein